MTKLILITLFLMAFSPPVMAINCMGCSGAEVACEDVADPTAQAACMVCVECNNHALEGGSGGGGGGGNTGPGGGGATSCQPWQCYDSVTKTCGMC